MARRAAAQRQRQARSRGDARGADAMKPIGPIPPQFAGQQGDLMIGGRRAADWVAAGGDTPLFLSHMAAGYARIAPVRAAMPRGLDLQYAICRGASRDNVCAFGLTSGVTVPLQNTHN